MFVRRFCCALALGIALASNAAEEKVNPETTDVAPPSHAAPMVVYDTALAAGWQNWSWAKTDLSITLSGSARKPIRVEAGGWQALYLQHAAFSTSGYKQLELLIQGSAPQGEVRVFTLTDGKVNGTGRLVTITNTGWKLVVMPLAELAAEDKMIDGIWVQNASGNDLPRFYVTEIKFQ
jgi:hypothetical protein